MSLSKFARPFYLRSGYKPKPLDASVLTSDEKTWLAKIVTEGRQSVNWVADNWKLPPKTVGGWVTKLKKGLKIADRQGGRPTRLDVDKKLRLVEFIYTSCYNRPWMEVIDAANDLCREMRIQDQATGDNLASELIPDLSLQTLKNYCKELKLNKGNAEPITAARAEAVASIRNMVSMAVGQYIHKDVKRELKFNLDFTHMTVGDTDEQQNVEVVYQGPRSEQEYGLKAPPQSGGGSGGFMKYSINVGILNSAAGYMAPPIYVVADSQMKKLDFHVIRTPHLDLGVNMEDAYVVFVHDRSGNK